MSAAIITLAKLGIGAAEPVTQRLDFADFDLGLVTELKDMNGTRGSYDKDFGRVRKNLIRVAPTFRSQPTAVELTYLLPWITGQAGTGSPVITYALSNTAATRYLHFDPGQGDLFKLTGVAVDEFSLTGSQGEPLEVSLGLIGQSYTVAGSFPAINLDITTQPFLFIDCTLSANGGSVTSRDFSFSISNGIDRNRYLNSNTLTALNKLNRTVNLSLTVPYGDFTSLFGYGVDATGAVGSVVATFTNGNSVLTLTATNVGFPPISPSSPFQAESFLTLTGECYRPNLTGTPVTITLNPTP